MSKRFQYVKKKTKTKHGHSPELTSETEKMDINC